MSNLELAGIALLAVVGLLSVLLMMVFIAASLVRRAVDREIERRERSGA